MFLLPQKGLEFLSGTKLCSERRWRVRATSGACVNLFLGATVHKRYGWMWENGYEGNYSFLDAVWFGFW